MSGLEAREGTEVTTRITGLGDIGGGLGIGFATLCFCFWANGMGYTNGLGWGLAIGLVLIGFFVVYLVGGLHYLKMGDTVSGAVYITFAHSFGLWGGLLNAGGAIAAHFGMEIDYTIAGISFLCSGIFVLCLVPGFLRAPKTVVLLFLTAGLGVTSYGLAGVGVMPALTAQIGGWSLLISGIVTYYNAVAGVVSNLGIVLPTGKPFVRDRLQEATATA